MGKSFDSPKVQVLKGLQGLLKEIPCSLLYDDRGSELYEKITELEEYYPFRVEEQRLKEHARNISASIPEGSVIVELGCGTARKSSIVLSAVQAHYKRYILNFTLSGILKICSSTWDVTKTICLQWIIQMQICWH